MESCSAKLCKLPSAGKWKGLKLNPAIESLPDVGFGLINEGHLNSPKIPVCDVRCSVVWDEMWCGVKCVMCTKWCQNCQTPGSDYLPTDLADIAEMASFMMAMHRPSETFWSPLEATKINQKKLWKIPFHFDHFDQGSANDRECQLQKGLLPSHNFDSRYSK